MRIKDRTRDTAEIEPRIRPKVNLIQRRGYEDVERGAGCEILCACAVALKNR